MNCETCKEQLINIGDFWLHPETQCPEEDGTNIQIIDQTLFDKFQKKYSKKPPTNPPPKPSRTHRIARRLKNFLKRILGSLKRLLRHRTR